MNRQLVILRNDFHGGYVMADVLVDRVVLRDKPLEAPVRGMRDFPI